ncbi:hypothetical protein TNCV_4927191 [Trichonephila clavipes]|nr:hypothetical protein TNCV_4927191 [Trichonephila clavipes]
MPRTELQKIRRHPIANEPRKPFSVMQRVIILVRSSATKRKSYVVIRNFEAGDTLLRTPAFEWHRRFREGRESFEDGKISGCPQTSHTIENIENVSEVVFEVKSAELKNMAKNGFQKYFDDIYKPWHLCVVTQGSYFNGACVSE